VATGAGAAPATAADLADWATRTCCLVGGCTTTFRGAVTPRTLPAHLARSHKLAAVPAEWVRALRLAGCRYCGRLFRTVVDSQPKTSLSRHEAWCDERPPREPEEESDPLPLPTSDAGGFLPNVGDDVTPAVGAAAGDGAAAWAPARPLHPPPTLFLAEPSEWARRLGVLLLLQAPTPDSWPALAASRARTTDYVAASLLPTWRQLGADALS